MSKEPGSKWKLGMFVTIGLVLFAGTIYFVGKQKNLFGSTFHLTAKFKSAGGLKEGNNVRFFGINIGTVNSVKLTDSFVTVDLVIKNDVQPFIKTDATATIGSDGLMGDKVLTIMPGASSQTSHFLICYQPRQSSIAFIHARAELREFIGCGLKICYCFF